MSRSYKFIDHTADIAAKIIGSSLEELFSAGAEAWSNSIIEDNKLEFDDSMDIELTATSKEELLITFLNELNYLLITKKWLCLSIQSLKVFGDADGCELSAELKGTRVKDDLQLKHEIKSVTYHQVAIVEKYGEYSTLIVFDI